MNIHDRVSRWTAPDRPGEGGSRRDSTVRPSSDVDPKRTLNLLLPEVAAGGIARLEKGERRTVLARNSANPFAAATAALLGDAGTASNATRSRGPRPVTRSRRCGSWMQSMRRPPAAAPFRSAGLRDTRTAAKIPQMRPDLETEPVLKYYYRRAA